MKKNYKTNRKKTFRWKNKYNFHGKTPFKQNLQLLDSIFTWRQDKLSVSKLLSHVQASAQYTQ